MGNSTAVRPSTYRTENRWGHSQVPGDESPRQVHGGCQWRGPRLSAPPSPEGAEMGKNAPLKK